MELGPQNHDKDGLLGPNSIIVVHMDPLGKLMEHSHVPQNITPRNPILGTGAMQCDSSLGFRATASTGVLHRSQIRSLKHAITIKKKDPERTPVSNHRCSNN